MSSSEQLLEEKQKFLFNKIYQNNHTGHFIINFQKPLHREVVVPYCVQVNIKLSPSAKQPILKLALS